MTEMEDFRHAYDEVMGIFRHHPPDWPKFVEAAYDDDVVVMPPNSPVFEGRGEVLSLLRRFPTMTGHRQEPVEVIFTGDLAIVRDWFACTLSLPGKAPFDERGKTITVWRRQAEGGWKILREIWNSDLPAPG
jgi:ketosteroid isomerase-like protein